MQHTVLPALADNVFRSQPASEAAFVHPAWQEVRLAALEALDRGGVTVLLGPPGSGKTLLLRDLARTLRNVGRPVWLVERAAGLDGVNQGIVLVDEADSLGTNELAALCARRTPILLAALPGFAERLLGQPAPVRRLVLGRLSPEDVARYVAGRLVAAGCPRDLLEPEAVLALARQSGGLMRSVNTLGGTAVLLARLAGSSSVGPLQVQEAAAMRGEIGDIAVPLAVSVPAPSAASPAPLSSSNRGGTGRRRAVLGMVAAGGALFAVPWLAWNRLASQSSATDPSPAPRSPPPAGTDPFAIVDGAVSTPNPVSGAALAPAAGARPDLLPVSPPGTPDLPHPEPVPQDNKSASAQKADGPRMPTAEGLFQGSIYNETMARRGYVTIRIRKRTFGGDIAARFEASQGLSGSGVLLGSVTEGGRINVSGQLLMGRTPYSCDLKGTIARDTLTGTADFRDTRGAWVARSAFTLARAE